MLRSQKYLNIILECLLLQNQGHLNLLLLRLVIVAVVLQPNIISLLRIECYLKFARLILIQYRALLKEGLNPT